MSNNKPIDVKRDGRLKANIWRNENENGLFYSVTLARIYKDKNGDLRDTGSFRQSDLLPLSELQKSAYARVTELKRHDRHNKVSKQDKSSDKEGREAFKEKRTPQDQVNEPQR